MRIVLSTVQVPFLSGGAELHVQSLSEALVREGHEVAVVSIPFKWYPPERIHEHLLACRLLDLTEANGLKVDRVIGLKFPAYHVRHPNKVTWIIHQFRTAFEMWGSPDCDLSPHPNGKSVRDSIEAVERTLLPEARALYANSRTVAGRLKHFCNIDAQPLYHPPRNAADFHSGEYGDYLYFPSRINKWKRQALAIEALAQTRNPVHLRISGPEDKPGEIGGLKEMARSLGVENRVAFLGPVRLEEMIACYAGCRAVVFPAEQEDYGYVTLEAMLSSKPVITCTDSGGPTEFIRNGEEGFVCNPDPTALADAMDLLWESRSLARECGAKARSRYDEMGISWKNVVKLLLQ